MPIESSFNEIDKDNLGPTEKIFVNWLTFYPNRIVFFILAVIFIVELLIMYILDHIQIQSSTWEAFVDSTMLTVAITAIFWRTIFSPLRRLDKANMIASQKELHLKRELAAILFQKSQYGVARISPTGKLTHVNSIFKEIFKIPASELRGLNIKDILKNSNNDDKNVEFKKILGEGLETHSFQTSVINGGKETTYQFDLFSIRGLQGEVSEILCMVFETY